MTDFPPPHLARYGAVLSDYDAFVEALRSPLPQTLAVNGLRTTAEELAGLVAGRLHATAIPWFPGAFRLAPEDRPGRDWTFTAGLYTVQEEASLVPVRMLAVRPGHRVLDLCAAPGNKTAQLALALGNRGTLVANDLKMSRMTPLFDVCRRLGLVNVSTTGHDGAVYPVPDGQFDRILVDAPCTAEGKARRGYLRASTPAFRAWITGQQRALLRRALALCRPGGRIVYATCTFAPEENEAVLSELLEESGGRLRLLAPDFEVPGAAPGLDAFAGRRFHPELRHARRLWPQRTDTGGFFAAVLERVDDAPAAPVSAAPLPPAASAARVEGLLGRFAVAPERLAGLHFFEERRHLRVLDGGHTPPAGIAYETRGLDVSRLRGARPKPTTAAAMAFGPGATGNLVDLDAPAFAAWRARREVRLPVPAGASPGLVLVRHRGLVTGTGFLRVGEDGEGRLESQFPKAWVREEPFPDDD